jgi:hypothetical protein
MPLLISLRTAPRCALSSFNILVCQHPHANLRACYRQVREDTLKKVPLGSRAETHAAIRALLASLGDPFTRFLDPQQYSALRWAVQGCQTCTNSAQMQGAAQRPTDRSPRPLRVCAACQCASSVPTTHCFRVHRELPAATPFVHTLLCVQAKHSRLCHRGGRGGVLHLPPRRRRCAGCDSARARRPRRAGRHPAGRPDPGDRRPGS